MRARHAVVRHAHSLSSRVVMTVWLLHAGLEPPLGLSRSSTRASKSNFHIVHILSSTVWSQWRRVLKIKSEREARTLSSASSILVKLVVSERYRTIRRRRTRTEQSFSWSGILSCRTNTNPLKGKTCFLYRSSCFSRRSFVL